MTEPRSAKVEALRVLSPEGCAFCGKPEDHHWHERGAGRRPDHAYVIPPVVTAEQEADRD